MDVAAWVAEQGGVVRVRRIEAGGATRHQISRACDRGQLRRVTRGWVAHAGRPPTAEAVVQGNRPLVPRHPDALEDGIEIVLATVAACQPFESALAVWESALRRGDAERSTLVRLPLSGAARRILEAAEMWSDSGLETFVVPRLRWLGLPLRRQIWVHGHRVDLLIGERLVLQIDGGHHVGAQREADISHDAALMLRGYHVIRVGHAQVADRLPNVDHLPSASEAAEDGRCRAMARLAA